MRIRIYILDDSQSILLSSEEIEAFKMISSQDEKSKVKKLLNIV